MKIIFRKTIAIFFILVFLSNFVMTNYVYAENSEASIWELISGKKYKDEDERKDDLSGRIEDTLKALEDEQESEGGILFTPISKFIVGIGDGIIATLQGSFLGDGEASNFINSHSIKEMTPADIADLGKDENKTLLQKFGITHVNDNGVPMYKIKYSIPAVYIAINAYSLYREVA